MIITSSTSLQDLFNMAVQSLSDVQSGEIFLVKDLFRGFEWNRIEIGARTQLGRMFFAYAQTEGAIAVTPLGKTPQNQQIYKKI